jgi:hypothetical protein
VDGTEKPEAGVLRRFAAFAAATRGRLSEVEAPRVAIVTSQALQYSALNWLALDAQMKAVRALEYSCRVPAAVVAENQLAQIGRPRLVILPSPLAFGDEAWAQLVNYAKDGGTLLVTGSMERDLHWQATARLRSLGLDAAPQSLTFHQAELDLGNEKIPLSFAFDRQQFAEVLATPDGRTFHELSVGSGKIYVTNFPVELADGLEPTAAVYRWALAKIGLESPFTGTLPSTGLLVRRAVFHDALLYLFVSERAGEEEITLSDRETHAEFRFRLASRRARLLLLDRQSNKVLASFGND